MTVIYRKHFDPRRFGSIDLRDYSGFDGDEGDPMAQIAILEKARNDLANGNKSTIIIPDGARIKIPRGFLMCRPDDPTASNFSMWMVRENYSEGHINPGRTVLKSLSQTEPVVELGPGQHMGVKGFTVWGPGDQGIPHSRALDERCVGIGIRGGNGGAVAPSVENMTSIYVRKDLVIDSNQFNSMAEFVYVKRLEGGGDTVVESRGEQTRSVKLEMCRFAGRLGVVGGLPISVDNGMYAFGAGASETFTIASVGAMTELHDGSNANGTVDIGGLVPYRFYPFLKMNYVPFVIADPDALLPLGAYQAFGVPYPSFGTVPFVMESWDVGTSTALMRVWPYWQQAFLGDVDLSANELFAAETAAATTLYAAEWSHFVMGAGICADNVYFEQGGNALVTVAMSPENNMGANMKINIGHTGSPLMNTGAGPGHPMFELSRVFPMFADNAGATNRMTVEGFGLGSTSTAEGAVVAFSSWPYFGTPGIKFVDCPGLINPTVMSIGMSNELSGELRGTSSRCSGNGEFDRLMFGPATGSRGDGFSEANGIARTDFIGWVPKRDRRPAITPTQTDKLTNPVTENIGSYMLPCGEVPYTVLNPGGVRDNAEVMTGARYYTHGQELDATIECTAGSPVAWVSGTDKDHWHAGHKINLDNGVDGPLPYIITSMQKNVITSPSNKNKITICRMQNGQPPGFKGDPGEDPDHVYTFTGAQIGQDAYDLKYWGAAVV